MIKIEAFSEAIDKQEFLTRFSLIPNRAGTPPATYWIHFLNLFTHVKKELYIASDKTRDLGRICVNETAHAEDMCFFGMLEYPIENKEVLNKLLFHSESWAKENKKRSIYGPIDINVWFNNRFNYPSDPQYNFEPSYPAQYAIDTLEYGFELDQDYLSSFFDSIDECIQRTSIGFNKASDQGYTFRKLDLSRDGEIDLLYDLNTISFSNNYLYEPITKNEYEQTYIKFINQDNLDLSFFICDENKKELGYVYCLTEGEYFVIKSLLIMPSAQGAQLSSALVHKALKNAKEKGFIKGAGAMVRKGNISEFFFKNIGTASHSHTYTLVKKDLS